MRSLTIKKIKSTTFPVLYEHGKKKAVLVDIEIFDQIKIIVDNLLNRSPEPEDKIIAEADILEKIIERYENKDIKDRGNWRKELDEL